MTGYGRQHVRQTGSRQEAVSFFPGALRRTRTKTVAGTGPGLEPGHICGSLGLERGYEGLWVSL